MNEIQIVNTPDKSYDISTGLARQGENFVSNTGFEYFGGVRDFEGLKIAEVICRGVGVEYLACVRVFDANDNLIVDVPVSNGIRYSREVVRELVLVNLLSMLQEAAKKNESDFSREVVRKQLDKKWLTIHRAMRQFLHGLIQ
jgi:hypothetical protein